MLCMSPSQKKLHAVICPATDTSQSLDMYDAAATQLLQHLPLFSQLFVTVTAMQALDAAFLAPAAPVQRSVATSRSLKRSSTRRVASKPVGNALAPAASAVGTLLGATAAYRGAQRSKASKARRRQGPPATTLNPEEDVKTDSWGEIFVWQKAWYPMAVIEDLDGTRPTKLQLLGEDLVAWVDGDGEWRVFEDRCPHRAVPLSEGRIEKDGTLMCSYHGWRFNGEGKVTAIPQATEEKFSELQQNARACASARPAQVRCGVLWVWGESGENAALEAALQELSNSCAGGGPNIPPEAEDPAYEGRAKFSVWSHRDVPYGWEVAFENVTDPAHVAVAHHNIVSNRYEDPCPLKIDWVRKPSNKEGFKYTIEQVGKNIVTTMDFKPPSQMHIRTSYDDKSGASLTLIINFIPTKPGWSRLVGTTLIITGENGEKPDGFAIYSAPLPRWVTHLLGPLFLHQDQVFLHYQQIILEKERRKSCWGWDDVTPASCSTDLEIAQARWEALVQMIELEEQSRARDVAELRMLIEQSVRGKPDLSASKTAAWSLEGRLQEMMVARLQH
eukprot:s1101_g2.t2